MCRVKGGEPLRTRCGVTHVSVSVVRVSGRNAHPPIQSNPITLRPLMLYMWIHDICCMYLMIDMSSVESQTEASRQAGSIWNATRMGRSTRHTTPHDTT